MVSERFEILVLPSGLRFSVEKGTNLLEQLGLHDVPVSSPCGGGGTCRKCAVWLGTFNPADFTIPKTETFDRCCDQFRLRQQLTCQVSVNNDLVVWIPLQGKTQIYTEHIMDDALPEEEPTGVECFFPDSVSNENDMPEIRYALAFDLGTTTLALSLLDVQKRQTLATNSRHNPQSRFGDDVIARVQKASESDELRIKLQRVVVDTLNEMIEELASEIGIRPEQITVVAVAGNTVMQQLFCGIDSTELGSYPFTPAVDTYPMIRADEIGIKIHPWGILQLFPILGGFVGGDIVAGILVTDMMDDGASSLLIDVGTNGEMVLQHEGRLLCAATAAGPAFEGARIKHGMTAASGAIEKVTFDRESGDLVIQTIGAEPAVGICGSGLIDLAAELIRLGVILPNGQMVTKSRFVGKNMEPISRRLSDDEKDRFFIIDEKQGIVLTQHDVRQLQLASGAIHSGIVLLLREAGVRQEDLKTVYLAGGFGNYIRRENAQQLGILPSDIPTERIRFCGNTSLAGAKQILLNRSKFEMMHEIRRMAKHVDLSRFPDFQTVFAESMFFPNR